MNKASVVVVLFSLIALINAQCSCQSKPPVDIKYPGEACECSRQYPIQMEVPKITEHRDAHYDYGFTIERPQEAPSEVKYTFDFHMEKPKPMPKASLATYAFEVQKPVQKVAEDPQRYTFDYQIQTPVVARSGPSNLEGLFAHVDKVVVQKQDCQDKNSCQCSSYKPTIDMLQRCPRHGHLYQYGGPLHPNQQRYNQDFRSIEPSVPFLALASSDRPKRNVASPFPIQIKGLLPGLRSNNHILKAPQPVEDKNQNRIDKIIKQNFGEDPTENIDELLRPKPLGSTQKINFEAENAEVPDVPDVPTPAVTAAFLSKIKPKLDEARANFRSQISKIVNKARLDAIKANHAMRKRSTELDSTDHGEYLNESFEESFEPIWIADVSVEDQDTENGIDSKSVNDDVEPISSSDRFRKHCDRCGELAKKFPCPSCAGIPVEAASQNVQMNQESPIRYVPEYHAQPRYASDRFTPATDDVTVGSYHNRPAYGELQDILSKNSEAMHLQNRRIGDGHLIQPMNFEHASEAIRFIQELTLRNNQYNEDFRSNRNSYDVGANAQNFHSKRSFKIVPLAERDDGSVYLKISPVESPKRDVEEKIYEKTKIKNPSNFTKLVKDGKTKGTIPMAPKVNENNNFGDGNQKTNFEKFVRNGKKYEILALDGSDGERTGSEEDLEILKYIYEVNQRGHADDNASDASKLPNARAQMET